ncbi:Iron-sulfur cluster insertion protein ErpA [bacterium HR30]|nr:Iron-sulfur cluster insertion protein ErpA [bacterium HR30]
MERQEGNQEKVVATGELIQLTPLAAEQARKALERKDMRGGVLRVGVIGGGCSGMQYSLSLDREAKAGDVVFEQQGVRIAVEEQAVPYLKGTVIDYVSGLHSAGFKFVNPNAVRTCGCGSSFAPAEEGR